MSGASELVASLREHAASPVHHWEDWANRATTLMAQAAYRLSALAVPPVPGGPVAWRVRRLGNVAWTLTDTPDNYDSGSHDKEPLYATPQPQPAPSPAEQAPTVAVDAEDVRLSEDEVISGYNALQELRLQDDPSDMEIVQTILKAPLRARAEQREAPAQAERDVEALLSALRNINYAHSPCFARQYMQDAANVIEALRKQGGR